VDRTGNALLPYSPNMLVWVAVTDMQRAIKFYKETLELNMIIVNPNRDWAEFNLPGTGMTLAIYHFPELDEVPTAGGATICFFVHDLDEAIKELTTRGVIFVTGKISLPNGKTFAGFIDPDGNHFQMAQNLATTG